ncbi:sulfotransferase family protein [Limobrevibacterium gyesilva]|uniref:Sulfotransferase family 2 domain-containing protein n=1 Tax=Limobrevibacterium gyesilva TaxID=2991712 RepID=A0AA42CG37_9PROT|nr:sulfotransferase family 2 domain-containing protein [Limobrevibacterium gyesilva]MCW3475606.1 sulfotransferase family 2 domain-containing protein [Limobrevibacterium gyesilva]
MQLVRPWPTLRIRRRTALIHYHIFKNAGTSVDSLLAGYFGSSWAAFEGATPVDIVDARRLAAYLAAHPDIRAVSSHLARPPLPARGCAPIVFLRDPIDRARSVYRYLAQDPTQPGAGIAAARSFAGFVAWALDEPDGGGVVIRNYQVIHLSAASFRTPHIWHTHATASDLRKARALLRSWPAFGIVRRFADSLRWFDRAYGTRFPGLFAGEVHANSTNPAFRSERDEWDRASDELGPALFQRLLDANSLDLELYQWALSRFRAAAPAAAAMAPDHGPAIPAHH